MKPIIDFSSSLISSRHGKESGDEKQKEEEEEEEEEEEKVEEEDGVLGKLGRRVSIIRRQSITLSRSAVRGVGPVSM